MLAPLAMIARTEQELRDAESHSRQIIASAVEYAIISCDMQARITSWNEGARRLLGWAEEDMLGQPLHRIFTPEDVASRQLEREMADAVQYGRGLDERWQVRKGGQRFWASGELMPIRNDVAQVVGYVKILRDRTGQKRSDAELRRINDTLKASEERLQLALDVGGMGIWQGNVNSQESTWWPGMDTVHGLPPGAAPLDAGQYLKMIHPDDRARVMAAVEDTLSRRGDNVAEYRVVWPDGSVHWIEGRAKLILDREGRPSILAGVCLDVTRRKRAQDDLRFLAEASAELAGLTDYQSTLDKIAALAVPRFADWCAVDVLETDGSLRRVSVAHVDPAKLQLARDLGERYPPDPSTPGGTWKVLRTGQAELVPEITDESLAVAIADEDHLAALRSLGLRSYMGVPLAVRGKILGVITFVTSESGRRFNDEDLALAQDLARRAAVAVDNATLLRALQDSDQAKDVFLATLAHELRNPLAPISNGISLIKRAPDDRKLVEQIGGVMERQVVQLSRLVDDLLDVSRISTGKIELKMEPTNLVSILASAIETSRPHVEAAHHKLSINFTDEATEVMADHARMAQVFANLLNNAAKYTPRGGKIDVSTEAEGADLVVRVADNGTGIAPDMLGKIFGLFTQVTHPSERRQGGLGIGLSLVDGLVRLHGGSVVARSAGLDQGSEFIVRLPRLAPADGHTAPQLLIEQATTDTPAHARRVLVVDDNLDAACTVAALLGMFGNEVAMAHDGASAVARTAEFRPDVVLLDIGLPDINGYQVARRIRKLEGVRQPILIALTGWGQQHDKKMATQAGFDHHWTKPVDAAKLQELSSR